LSAFLSFIVERYLSGDLSEIKEYRIGSEVYERGSAFDPRVDNIVRVEANRLRTKLREYYEKYGSADPVRIELPKGTYVPAFEFIRADAPEVSPETDSHPQQAVATDVLRPSRRSMYAVILLFVAVGAAGSWYYYAQARKGAMRRSMAVLGFKNITGADAGLSWLSTAFSEILTMDLEGGRIRTIPVDRVAEMRRDLGLTESDGFSRDQLRRVRRRIGADLVVAGAYTSLGNGGQIRLDLRVQDARSGETISTVSQIGTEEEWSDLIARVSEQLQQGLGLLARPQRRPSVAALLSDAGGAMRLYSQGLDELRRLNAVGAKQLLERAAQADPSNPLIFAALADAWHTLGYDVNARDAALRATRLATALGRVEQLEIEARYRMYMNQWREATRAYETLLRSAPDSIDDALALAWAQMQAQHPHDALATLDKLRALAPPVRDDPRIDFTCARVMGYQSDYRRARVYAISAEQKAKVQGAMLLYAKARLFESGTMLNLGISGDGQVREEARRLCAQLGDRACVLQALRVDANRTVPELPARAKQLYEQALRIARDMGFGGEIRNLVEGRGVAETNLGQLAAAERDFRELLSLCDAEAASPVSAQLDLGDLYRFEGRLPEAEHMYGLATLSARRGALREFVGSALIGMADLLRLQGDTAEALKQANAGLDMMNAIGQRFGIAAALLVRGDVLSDAGDFDRARADYNKARGLLQGFNTQLAQADVAVARLLLRRSQPSEAESLLSRAIPVLHAAGDNNHEPLAWAALVEALIEQQKLPQALESAHKAEQSAATTQAPYSRLSFQIALARLEAARGNRRDALQKSSAAFAEASKLGYESLARAARTQLASANSHRQ
jgi:tetratricopeptide (TPR) repeat protein